MTVPTNVDDVTDWGYWGCIFDPLTALDYMAEQGFYSGPLLDTDRRPATGRMSGVWPGGFKIAIAITDARTDWPTLREPYRMARRRRQAAT